MAKKIKELEKAVALSSMSQSQLIWYRFKKTNWRCLGLWYWELFA